MSSNKILPESPGVLPPEEIHGVVVLPGLNFVVGCAGLAVIILFAGYWIALPASLLAAEVFATILGLFFFGSFKYQIHKNALTYGMLLIIVATFCGLSSSVWHIDISSNGWWAWIAQNLLSFHGLDGLIHADTMLFILGLTFFVSVIAQTRLLEGLTFYLLRKFRGAVLPTVIAVTAVVAFASGILDGVSMIGLTIRTLVIIMLLAAAAIAEDDIRRWAKTVSRYSKYSRSTAPGRRSMARSKPKEPSTTSLPPLGANAKWHRSLALWRWSRLSACSSGMASIIPCRCFWLPLQGSVWRCWELSS